ncbi:MAG TPA: acyl-CoA dehydrogenase family protein [Xanthobacteraceae bacterium]
MLERTTAATSADDCVARAEALAPLIAAHAARIEAQREIVPEVLAALHQARLFRMLLPRSCGGLEVDPPTFMRAVEALARADGSTAWCVVQASGCSLSAAYVEPAIAQEIFGDPTAVMAWGPGPTGTATLVPGGYRAAGRWGFASGIRHARWLGCHCRVLEGDGTPRLDPDGQPAERSMLIRKERAKVEDVWRVVGLKGTGSDLYSVDDLFVPGAYTFTRESAADRRESGPLYRHFTSYRLYGIGFAALALGLGRATLDAFVELAAAKVPYSKSYLLRDNTVIQSQVALAEAKLASARSYVLQQVHEAWEAAVTGATQSLMQRASLKLAGTYASHQAKDVIDTLYHAAGATAIFESNPFERRLRDIHTVLQQVQAHFANFELVGQVLLGLPSQTRLI